MITTTTTDNFIKILRVGRCSFYTAFFSTRPRAVTYTKKKLNAVVHIITTKFYKNIPLCSKKLQCKANVEEK